MDHHDLPNQRIWVRQLELLFPTYGKIKNVPNHQPDEVDEVDVSIRFSVELSQTLAGHKWYVTMVLTNHILVETHMYAQVNQGFWKGGYWQGEGIVWRIPWFMGKYQH